MPIDTVEDLRTHIALAIRVELTTIPPYLYAMFSLADPKCDAARLIRSVATEEMLHAALMANLLLAVGGDPQFAATAQTIRYPSPLPHHIPELRLDLERCSTDLVRRVFLTIERPEVHETPQEPDGYESLGQFYHALENGIQRLAQVEDLFAQPQLDRQLADPSAYLAVDYDAEDSGGLVGITDVGSAMAAIETVIHQGEGLSENRYADPSHQELTHYAKYLAIADGSIPLGDVLPAVPNPTVGTLPAALRPAAELANGLYGYLFVIMDQLFGEGTPDRSALVPALYGTMGQLGRVARFMMTVDLGDGTVAGPPFAAYRFGDPATARQQLDALADAATAAHPGIAGSLIAS